MPLFRRSPTESLSSDAESEGPTSTASAGTGTTDPAQQGKGRPTPKRREAEAARRTKGAPPKDRKEARARMREERARERAELMVALRTGDERKFPVRDRGPARHIARNWVDGRRNVGDYFWPFVIAAIVLLITPVPAVQSLSFWILLGYYLLLMLDSAWSLRGLNQVVKQSVPDPAHRKGTVPYAFGRTLQSRKRRLPAIQVERGWTKAVKSGELDPLS